jgi:hypothetical protein
MHIGHLRIQASSLQFLAGKINMALAQMDKLVKKLMLKFKNNSLLPNLDLYGLKLYEKALILYRDLCCWVQFLKEK